MSEDDVAYLDGYLDTYDDLPDGAWQIACEAAIAECPRFKGRDPYSVWMAWVKANSEQQFSEMVQDAQKEMESWSEERKASVQLQGNGGRNDNR